MRLIQAGKLHLSAKEMKRLRNLNVELKRLKKNKVLPTFNAKSLTILRLTRRKKYLLKDSLKR